MNIGILGGGAVGLYTGLNLIRDGHEVHIFEEHNEIGRPLHCTGVISRETIDEHIRRHISVESIILNRMNRLTVSIADDYTLEAKSGRYAYIIDRAALEHRFAQKFLDMGGRLTLNIRGSVGDDSVTTLKGEKYAFDLVIISTGSTEAMNRAGTSNILPGYQADVIDDDGIWGEGIQFYIDKEINREFFIWIVPIGKEGSMYRVGTAAHGNPLNITRDFLSRHGVSSIADEYYGHVVLTGPITPFTSGGVVYIGDAAGQTKITTGGGLRYGFSAGDILSEVLREGLSPSAYEAIWLERWGGEIRLQRMARKVFLKLGNKEIMDLLVELERSGLLDKLLREGKFDMHMRSLIKLLLGSPVKLGRLASMVLRAVR